MKANDSAFHAWSEMGGLCTILMDEHYGLTLPDDPVTYLEGKGVFLVEVIIMFSGHLLSCCWSNPWKGSEGVGLSESTLVGASGGSVGENQKPAAPKQTRKQPRANTRNPAAGLYPLTNPKLATGKSTPTRRMRVLILLAVLISCPSPDWCKLKRLIPG